MNQFNVGSTILFDIKIQKGQISNSWKIKSSKIIEFYSYVPCTITLEQRLLYVSGSQ